MKFRDVRRLLKEMGYVVVAQRGSHEQWKHPGRAGRVTVAGRDSDTVHPKTLAGIRAQLKGGDER